MDEPENSSMFNDLLSQVTGNVFSKPADKNRISDQIERIWKDETQRKELIEDLENRKHLLEQLASCVRSECLDNSKQLSNAKKKFRKVFLNIWIDFVNIQLKERHPGIEIDSFFPTIVYLIRNNFKIWAEDERATWWATLDITVSILTHYSLADLPVDQVDEFFPMCIKYFEQSIETDQRKDQLKLANLLHILVKDIRLLQSSTNFNSFINYFTEIFVQKFKWESMNAARTIVLDIIYMLFVEISHSCRLQLLNTFLPLFRKLFPFMAINESSVTNLQTTNNDSPCFNDSLIRFFEIFLACAYPKGHIQILNREIEEFNNLIDSFTKHLKRLIDQQFSKNVMLYRKAPELVIPKHRVRFVARFVIVQHNLMDEARSVTISSSTQNSKRPRLSTCLEEMLASNNAENLHYLVIYAEIFDKFEHLLSNDIINQIIQQVARLDVSDVRKNNGSMDTFVRTLAILFKSKQTILPNEELKTLFNKALNWLHIPTVSDSACALLQNLLHWLPNHFSSQKLNLFDLVLKAICRMSRLTVGASHLLYYIIRTHDFDECFVFRNDISTDLFEPNTWRFRRQLIMFLLKDSEPNVDYSDLLLSILFIYPNAIQIDLPVLYTDDDIDNVDNNLCWITKTDEVKRVYVDKKPKPISTSVVTDLLQYLSQVVMEFFESEDIEPAKMSQVWRVLTVFSIKAEHLNHRTNYFEMTEIKIIQERLAENLCDAAHEADENDWLMLDIGCYWEFVCSSVKNAIEAVALNLPVLWKFIAFWKQSGAPQESLDATIKRARLENSSFVGKIMFKLAANKNLIAKIRLLRTYGKYLSQKEYTQIIGNFRNDFDNELERVFDDNQQINFLKTMFSREIILNANRKAVHFESNFEFLLKNSTPDLILVYASLAFDDSNLLLTWFNNSYHSLVNYPSQLAFFVQRFFKELSWHSYLHMLIEMTELVHNHVCFYMPDFHEIKSYVQFLNKFKAGCFDDLQVQNWSELLDSKKLVLALYELRRQTYRILQYTTPDYFLHLATAINTISIVLKDLKVQGKVKSWVDFLVLDLLSIARCLFVKLFSYKPKDDLGLSELVVDWLCNGIVGAIRIYGINYVGFMALDIFYDRREEYSNMWSNVIKNHLPYIIKYNLVVHDPFAEEVLTGFNDAYTSFQNGSLSCYLHPVVKTKLFWIWLIPRLRTQTCEKKCVAQLKLLWILCPWLRSNLAQVLCLFDEETLRNKNHKVVPMFLAVEENRNLKFIASLLLFDYDEFMSDKITSSLYCTICQYEEELIAPALQENFDYDSDDYFVMFMFKCFVDHNVCFNEMKPFINVVFSNPVFAVLAFAILYQRLDDNNQDVSEIAASLKVLFDYLDRSQQLKDYEILLLAVISEVSTDCVGFLCLPFIRNLVKAGLLEEAFFFFKYYMDMQEIPERKVFYIKSNERRSFIRWVQVDPVDEVANLFMDICFALKDDFLVQGLPLSQQYNSLTRAFIAEKRYDFGIAASLYEEIEQPFAVSNALYFLGHKHFDLTDKDNYRRVIDLSHWPATEPTELSYPKSNENHNSTLYSLFRLNCRNENPDLSSIWKRKLNEVEKQCVVFPDLLNECRDIKLLESLNLLKTSPNDIKLPENFDKGIASAFLLAGWRKPQSDSADQVFDSLFSRMQKITLERVRELREKKSFQRAQTLVKILEEIAHNFEAFRSTTAMLELARLHFANNEANAAKFLLQSLATNSGINDSSTRQEILQRAEGQNRALIMAAEISDNSQKADLNFTQALKIANGVEGINTEYIYESLLKYANFAFKRYKELDDHTKSQHFILQSDAVVQWEQEIKKVNTNEEKNRRKREMEVEHEEINRIKNERKKFLHISSKNFLKALEFKTEDECIIPSLVSMLIQNVDDQELMFLVADTLENLPAHIWLPVQEVLTSYLFGDNPISSLVKQITTRLLTSHPYHSVYPLYFQSSKTNVRDQALIAKRTDTINRLFHKCIQNNRSLNLIFKHTKAAHEMFQEFGNADMENTGKFECIDLRKNSYMMTSNVFKLQRNFNILQSVPIPTCTQPLNDPNNITTENMICFAEIMGEIIKAGGLSAPKIMEVRGTDGQFCKIIFKNEDLRQDGLVQLLFNLSNIIIRSSVFRSKKLRSLQTYHVVPIDRSLGLIECCKDTQSLNDYLIGVNRSGGAHSRLRPNELHVKEAHKRLSSARSGGNQELLKVFTECCNEISPVFRYFFYENYAQPHSFIKHIRYYTDSLALWSIVCYIVGLGDRHLNNIMINQSTGELVHIDLGMIFEYSKRVLPIPEKVPFRLTRDLADPILVESVNGRFKHVAMHVLEKLQQNSQVIIGISSILLHDPISTFGGDIKLDGVKRNMLAETAISRLRSKLEGRDLNILGQTVEQQVTQLINEAKDPKNLCLLFSGWMSFI